MENTFENAIDFADDFVGSNVQLYEFDEADLLVMRDEYHYNLRRIKKATETNYYPGYNEFADNELGALTAKLPSWYKLNSNR